MSDLMENWPTYEDFEKEIERMKKSNARLEEVFLNKSLSNREVYKCLMNHPRDVDTPANMLGRLPKDEKQCEEYVQLLDYPSEKLVPLRLGVRSRLYFQAFLVFGPAWISNKIFRKK